MPLYTEVMASSLGMVWTILLHPCGSSQWARTGVAANPSKSKKSSVLAYITSLMSHMRDVLLNTRVPVLVTGRLHPTVVGAVRWVRGLFHAAAKMVLGVRNGRGCR